MNSRNETSPALPELEAGLGYQFHQSELLDLALTHPSWLQEQSLPSVRSNQRLELLGDAVLGFLVCEMLYERFPDAPEGVLTRYRASLVKGPHLVELAAALELDQYIRCGKSERNQGGRGLSSRLEDALEALIGAIYLDGGLDAARGVVTRLYRDLERMLEIRDEDHNAKGRFQEWVQQTGGTTDDILYELVSSSGPDHSPTFEIELHFRGEKIGSGKGRSRKAAESEAARQGLEHLQ